MNINGSNDLVCHRNLPESLDHKGAVTIKPLSYLPIIKDLVVDRGAFDRIIEQSTRDWLNRFSGDSARHVFICGMFRTGSTLLEQMLAAERGGDAGMR